MDFATATTVERVDLLDIANLNLRMKVLELERDRLLVERDHLLARLLAKYAPGAADITVHEDGTIERPSAPPPNSDPT